MYRLEYYLYCCFHRCRKKYNRYIEIEQKLWLWKTETDRLSEEQISIWLKLYEKFSFWKIQIVINSFNTVNSFYFERFFDLFRLFRNRWFFLKLRFRKRYADRNHQKIGCSFLPLQIQQLGKPMRCSDKEWFVVKFHNFL